MYLDAMPTAPRVLLRSLRNLLSACALLAAGGYTAAQAQTLRDALPKPTRVEVSIPYPNAGMYLYRGIYGSFAGGRSRSTDIDPASKAQAWQDPLYQWQGEVGYFYTDRISGGFGFRINAGEPSGDRQDVENRYFLLARIHKAWPNAAAFAGMRLGVDAVNFSIRTADTLDLREPLDETRAGLGLSAGGGWKFSRYAGATLGQRLDFLLVPQGIDNPNRAVNFLTQPGIAIDILRIRPEMGENVKALYLLTELQFGQLLTTRGDWAQQFAWITGISMAF